MQRIVSPTRSQGFSLLELTVVVLLMGIVAAVTIPSVSATDHQRLAQAASEVAEAIRIARDEAIRTGDVYGIQISQTTQKITVYKADLGASPVGQEFILYHPIDKRLLNVTLSERTGREGVKIVNSQNPFYYAGYSRLKNLLFDAQGLPYWIITSSGTSYLLTDGTVELRYAGLDATVSVDAITGRVEIFQ